MANKFTLLKGIDEKATMEHLESVYSVVTRFKDLRTQMVATDLVDVFTIPSLFIDDSSGVIKPSAAAVAVDLFSDSAKVDIEVVKQANAYFLKYGVEYHGENVVWSGEKILNSCDTQLRDKLVESTRSWEEKYRGGPTYLKLLVGLILSTSEKSLRSLTDKLQVLRITDFPGENASCAVSFIQGAVLILTNNNNSAPTDLLTLVLRIFSSSTCPKFRSHIDNIDILIELGVTTYTLDKLLTNIDKKYIELVGRNEWNPLATSKTASTFLADASSLRKIMFFNCGAIGHAVAECPNGKNDAEIQLRKDIMRSYSSRLTRDKTSSGTPDPLLIPPGKGEPHEKFFNGVKKYWCGKRGCRKWTDHPSSEHPPSPSVTANLANATTPTSQTSSKSTDNLPSVEDDKRNAVCYKKF